jgi:site-specific DNA recombinase
VPAYGVRAKRGDFEPLISEDLFYRAQAVLCGRVPSTTPQQRAHPDFPIRAFVRCESCGRGLTGSWSKGRSEYYAYYHCRPGCRAVNVTKAKLEGLFADELALLQPSPGYMRLLKESVLQIWKARKAAVSEEIASAERAAKAIQDKLNRLDEAFLFDRSIDIETYDRHAEKLREELTLARIDRHSGQVDELDVEGILAFAERILPRASDLWVQASLNQRQRFQQLFFPDGIAFDGNRFIGTGVTAPAFSYLREIRTGNEGWLANRSSWCLGEVHLRLACSAKLRWTTFAWDQERRLVDLTGVSWNQVSGWLSRMAALRPLMPTRELQQD